MEPTIGGGADYNVAAVREGWHSLCDPTLQFSQFLIGPYIGDGSPVDQSMWIDNLRVATGRIP